VGVVIVGGGQAGLQAADSLRAGGYAGTIDIVADEPGTPYQRPPLSKDYLVPGKDAAPLPLRGPGFLAAKDIVLHDGVAAVAIERGGRHVVLADGRRLGYDHLVLATGAANRRLTCDGADLPGIHGLKTLPDAEALNAELPAARSVVVVGAGFIGLEFAAAARSHGAEVTVLEFAPRPMGRALTAVTADWFAASHARTGVRLRLNEGIERFEAGPDGRVAAAVSTAGERYAADLVVVGIGVVPNDQLAAAAGLETANGIVVDETLRTSDPAVLAVGDCASFPSVHTGTRIRLESVQNATDQGRHAAGTIMGSTIMAGTNTGSPEAYRDLPWFWSAQGSLRLQIAGLSAPGDRTVVTGDPEAGKFSVLCYRDGLLAAVESVDQPGEHIAARKLLAAGRGPGPDEAAAEGFNLKAFARQVPVPAGR